jgi:hypothetical protein
MKREKRELIGERLHARQLGARGRPREVRLGERGERRFQTLGVRRWSSR